MSFDPKKGRERNLLYAAINQARNEKGVNIPDVKIKRPKTPAARTRRRQAGELDRILQSSERSRSKNLKPAILLAIENRTSIYRWLKAACGRRKGERALAARRACQAHSAPASAGVALD